MSIAGWLLLGLVVPAVSVRSDSCADELEVALAENEVLRATLQRHGLSSPEPELDEKLTLDEQAGELKVSSSVQCDLQRRTSPAAAKPAVAMPMSWVPAVLVRRKSREIKVRCAASAPRLGLETLGDVYLVYASMH